jgi:pyruvate/2-oxoglutarate dehydrogenase complex dihydrolipoamide dehydrogenase (E3) component
VSARAGCKRPLRSLKVRRVGRQAVFHFSSSVTFQNTSAQSCTGGNYLASLGMAPRSDHEPDPDTTSSTNDVDIPILIVGGGPTGFFLGHMLSQFGGEVKCKCTLLC